MENQNNQFLFILIVIAFALLTWYGMFLNQCYTRPAFQRGVFNSSKVVAVPVGTPSPLKTITLTPALALHAGLKRQGARD